MEEQKKESTTIYKGIIVALALLLSGSLYYINKISSEKVNVITKLKSTITDKDGYINELKELKETYDAAISENTSLSEEIVSERDKVVRLMRIIEKYEGDVTKYRSEIIKLQDNMRVLINQNNSLTQQNKSLTIERDSTKVVLQESNNYNEVLLSQNEQLTKTIEKGSKLTVLNLKVVAMSVKSSGKATETEKSSRADVLKINFTIVENQIASSGDREYYVQVIDNKNNVLGEKQNISFGEQVLTYSFISKVKFQNETVNVSAELPGKDFTKGTYYVNVFDKAEIVSKTSFTLK